MTDHAPLDRYEVDDFTMNLDLRRRPEWLVPGDPGADDAVAGVREHAAEVGDDLRVGRG